MLEAKCQDQECKIKQIEEKIKLILEQHETRDNDNSN